MRRNLQPHEGRAARPWCLALAVLVTAAALCLGGGTAKAQDVKSYTRATFDQWLAKYKDAKPDFKVGDVLTAKDIERMRPFVFPGYVEQFNFPEFKATIAAPVDHTPRKDYMACTEKYQSQVRLLPDKTMANYVCGQPFPNSAHQRERSGCRMESRLELRVPLAEFRPVHDSAGHLGPLRRHARHSEVGDPPSDWLSNAGLRI